MKYAEKIKVEKAINRIITEEFDENDVETIFMKLRASCGQFPLFREVADFVAHNDERDKGILKSEFDAVALGIKFIKEMKGMKLDEPFPLWVKKHLEYQLNKASNKELMDKYRIGKVNLAQKIEKALQVNKKEKLVTLALRKTSQPTIDAIAGLLGAVKLEENITGEMIFESMLGVFANNDIDCDIEKFSVQKDKIVISVLYLIHNTAFKVESGVTGKAYLGCDDYSATLTSIKAGGLGLGNLTLACYVPVEVDGQNMTIITPVITTNLRAEDWLHESLVYEDGDNLRVTIKNDLLLTDKFKLNSAVI